MLPFEADGGFDIVLGNPPYVKLQNLMKVESAAVAWLQSDQGEASWRSTRTGNFDLYLPFIEQGLRLLAPQGRMGYIAPSLWVVNDHGRGLRALVHDRRQLERWTDFRSHQIFDEAITYTALQVFTKEQNDAVRIALAPGGESEAVDVVWSDADLAVPYDALPADREWLIATGAERRLIDRLRQDCLRLDDPSLTNAIFQGLITSADSIYHLDKIRDGQYAQTDKKVRTIVEIEDAIMKPLISGAEAKRYENPETSTYILFPYERTADGTMRLIPEDELKGRFRKAWDHLKKFESVLRAREGGKFDDNEWYRFGRAQSLDKQDHSKLIVAQTVPQMRVCFDRDGVSYLNNVRVNGIFPREGTKADMLLGCLNGVVADFVFRRVGKPKQGGWFEANKQFIAPLPIPPASDEDRAEVARCARDLQIAWTDRRELLRAAEDRLGALARDRHGPEWLFAGLSRRKDLIDQAPAVLTARGDRIKWADGRFDDLEKIEIARLQAALEGGARMDAAFIDGELRLFSGGAPVLNRIFMDEGPGRMAEAYWRYLLLSQAWGDAAGFASKLRLPPADHDNPAARQFVGRVQALAERTASIEMAEHDMNELLYRLYDLSDEERELVENERLRRFSR